MRKSVRHVEEPKQENDKQSEVSASDVKVDVAEQKQEVSTQKPVEPEKTTIELLLEQASPTEKAFLGQSQVLQGLFQWAVRMEQAVRIHDGYLGSKVKPIIDQIETLSKSPNAPMQSGNPSGMTMAPLLDIITKVIGQNQGNPIAEKFMERALDSYFRNAEAGIKLVEAINDKVISTIGHKVASEVVDKVVT